MLQDIAWEVQKGPETIYEWDAFVALQLTNIGAPVAINLYFILYVFSGTFDHLGTFSMTYVPL